ncbi:MULTISPECIES: TVP38/TMEM64 family protein [Methylococcus]|uniref:TVP38/TMEM64 family membrane protein n=1 Tax=Methylococcus capsulatus TaxID=414 RepID=A0ABZ2F1J3_METCP|nr:MULTISPECIES: VTT domain-containing protein [Methylococcus]MDF9392824.1 TVP38/TMEM64 family protein [Methylococcus capsulatus]UQN13191.1 VTT domain-containing protein [Methylococcus capsulatus]
MDKAKSPSVRLRVAGITLLVLVGAVPLLLAAPLEVWLAHLGEARVWFDGIGLLAPLVFILVSALLTAIGFPRLLFCVLGGLLFGVAWGSLWSELGTVLGAYGTFLFARWSARELVLRRYPKLQTLAARVQGRKGWWSVVLIRQIPVAGLYNDILLGISAIGHRDFWIGTGLGFLPQGIAATLIGAGMVQTDFVKVGQYFAAAATALLVLTLAWNRLLAQADKQHVA